MYYLRLCSRSNLGLTLLQQPLSITPFFWYIFSISYYLEIFLLRACNCNTCPWVQSSVHAEKSLGWISAACANSGDPAHISDALPFQLAGARRVYDAGLSATASPRRHKTVTTGLRGLEGLLNANGLTAGVVLGASLQEFAPSLTPSPLLFWLLRLFLRLRVVLSLASLNLQIYSLSNNINLLNGDRRLLTLNLAEYQIQ